MIMLQTHPLPHENVTDGKMAAMDHSPVSRWCNLSRPHSASGSHGGPPEWGKALQLKWGTVKDLVGLTATPCKLFCELGRSITRLTWQRFTCVGVALQGFVAVHAQALEGAVSVDAALATGKGSRAFVNIHAGLPIILQVESRPAFTLMTKRNIMEEIWSREQEMQDPSLACYHLRHVWNHWTDLSLTMLDNSGHIREE